MTDFLYKIIIISATKKNIKRSVSLKEVQTTNTKGMKVYLNDLGHNMFTFNRVIWSL